MLILLTCYPVPQVMHFGLEVISLHQTPNAKFTSEEENTESVMRLPNHVMFLCLLTAKKVVENSQMVLLSSKDHNMLV